MLRRRRQAEEAFAAFRMACLKSFGLVLALQVAAAWANGATPAAAAAPGAAPAAAAASGAPQHGAAAESATAAAAAAPAGHGQADMARNGAQHKTHKCTNVKLFSECRVNCEYMVEGKGAYFIFTDGEDGVPCKTRTLDGQLLSGACHQGLCMVKDQGASGPHTAAAVSPGAAAAGAVTPAAGHPAAPPAHAAAAAAKHKKA
ncbi:spidroin-2-like isoform X2 [Dermacentor albipictus]|uniref:spidroin-2-like isoform X2 n=1 Tax=Dermacentor albipictus TaxID=60249 RepID=UPI0038FCCC7D